MELANLVAGIDEVGRGPLAGPVVAAAVILDANQPIEGLADSKKLSEKKRAHLSEEIKTRAKFWGIGFASAAEIDQLNIHHATLFAMQRAYVAMGCKASQIYVDGLYCPKLSEACKAIVKGDQKVAEISAASILAKVTRDLAMEYYHQSLPQYGFDRHKGYATAQHIEALHKHGPCELHRRSYKPVRNAIELLQKI